MQMHDTTHDRVTAKPIFTGGKVQTVNARNDIVEAVAVGGGRILAVGSTTDIRALTVQARAKSCCVEARCCLASSTHIAI
jgi:hypothetical protein